MLLPARKAKTIPAHAGNTQVFSVTAHDYSVHPRACGEHNAARTHGEVIGSSPRMRGTPTIAAPSVGSPRFIPACAGNTLTCLLGGLLLTVHPRVCGEHAIQAKIDRDSIGSSPRVRGTHEEQTQAIGNYRFIPACAGNTALLNSFARVRPVHPRVCGEHYTSSRRSSARRFIPACAGNTFIMFDRPVDSSRFIPACAGNTIK